MGHSASADVSHIPNDISWQHKPCPHALIWQAPARADRSSGFRNPIETPVAGRAFAQGELIERAYCLEIEAETLQSSFLEPSLPCVSCGGKDVRLFPFGWSLLYEQDARSPNVVAEHRYEPPPAPPPSSELEFEDMEPPSPRHWLLFRAAQPIVPGEALRVAPLPGAGVPRRDLFGAAVIARREKAAEEDADDERWDDDDEVWADSESEEDEITPPAIGFPEPGQGPIALGASAMHGVGVFARRDIEKGEVIEQAPTLPLLFDHVEDTILNDYTFQSNTFELEDIQNLHLGWGCIYNHSNHPNVSHVRFSTKHPLVEAWVSLEFIPAGQELCHSYGKEYFKDRGMTVKQTAHEPDETPLCGMW